MNMDVLRQKIALDLLDALDEAAQSIFYIIQDGRFVYGNKHGCHITGLDPNKDVQGKPALTYVHPEDIPLITEMSRRAVRGEKPRPFEWRLRTLDGDTVWVMGLLTRINFNGRPALFGNYIDVTHIKQTASELQRTSKKVKELTVDLKSVREEERAQIAWELRENLGHSLETLKLEMEDMPGGGEPDQGRKELMLHKINSALDTMGRITSHLNTPDFDIHDLIDALKWSARDFRDQTGVKVAVKSSGDSITLGKKRTLAVYQFFREALKTLSGVGRFKSIQVHVEQEHGAVEMSFTCDVEKIKKGVAFDGGAGPFKPLSSWAKERHGAVQVLQDGEKLIMKASFPVAQSASGLQTRILLGATQPILAQGIRQIIAGLPDLVITEQAETFLELSEKLKSPDFDMALVDTSIFTGRAADNLKKIKDAAPQLPILLYNTLSDDDDFAVRMFRQGAAGYISRSGSTDELISAVHKVASGRKHISNRIAEKLAFEVDVYAAKPFHHKLSDRERQVMFMIGEGKAMKDIAEELCLSYKTIATYRNRVLEKMNMRTNTEIVRYVVSKGLI